MTQRSDIVQRLRAAPDIRISFEGKGYYEKKDTLPKEAADEIERLRAAVWAALPWLEELEHMGGIVDHARRKHTIEKMRVALGFNEQSARRCEVTGNPCGTDTWSEPDPPETALTGR